MIPLWEIYATYEEAKQPLNQNAEALNPKSNISNDRKQHRGTWIRRLSPIIALSILGVASSSFGYYTAHNQSSIALFRKPPLPQRGNLEEEGIKTSFIAIRRGKTFKASVMPNIKELRVYSIPYRQYAEGNSGYLTVDPELELEGQIDQETKWFKIISCQPEQCKDARNKYVSPRLLVCDYENCGATRSALKKSDWSYYLKSEAKQYQNWLDSLTENVGW